MPRLKVKELQALQTKLNAGEITKEDVQTILYECAWLKNYYDSVRAYGEQIIRTADIAQGRVDTDERKGSKTLKTDVGELDGQDAKV